MSICPHDDKSTLGGLNVIGRLFFQRLLRQALERTGHFFDHAIDLIHPPLWYIAWGVGQTRFEPGVPWFSLSTTLWLIVGFYVGAHEIGDSRVGRLFRLKQQKQNVELGNHSD